MVCTIALDHGAQAALFRPLWRMSHMRREQENIPLTQMHPFKLAPVSNEDGGIALELMEILLKRVVVEIGSLIGASNHSTNQI